MSFDLHHICKRLSKRESQSLWNRAMSFDKEQAENLLAENGLNPFGTGQCLST